MPQYMGIDYRYKLRSPFMERATRVTVFCAGIIISLFAYMTLNLMIDKFIQQENHLKINRVHQDIQRELGKLRNDVAFATDIIARDVRGDPHRLREDIIFNLPHIKNFDAMYLIGNLDYSGSANRDGVTSHDDIDVYPLYESAAAERRILQHTADKRVFKEYLLREYARDGTMPYKRVLILPDPPNGEDAQFLLEPVVKARNFALSSVIKKEHAPPVYLVALVNPWTVFGEDWLEEHSGIARMVLRDMQYGTRLYFMDRKYNGNEDIDFSVSGTNFDMSLDGDVWRLNVLPGADPRIVFVYSIAYLVLLFGVLLTLISTLYVWNNQKQARQLAEMNRMLAGKNHELNSEVAERERLNHALRKTEREYKAIVDAVNDIIFETDGDGKILFLNGTWEKIVGVARQKVIGTDMFSMIHPESRAAEREKFDQMVQGNKNAYRSITRLKTENGIYRTVELAISMLRQDDNRNMRVVGTITDIEERRRAEKALREAEKKYRTIVENAAGGIYQMTPQGKYISANPAMARILGYDGPHELLHNIDNAHQQVYADPDRRYGFIADMKDSDVSASEEFVVLRKDGKRIWVQENARVVKDDSGNILYLEGSLEDVTIRRKAEEDIRMAMTNSEIANRAKTEFLANMSHELRTPLNAIIGFSEIITDEVLGPIGNKQYWEYARDIHESGKGLLKIINEILDVARIEAGDRQLNESVVSLSRLSHSCLDFLMPKIEERKLQVKNDMADCTAEIMAEERAIKQILINLLSNAVKFTPEKGRITISCEAAKGTPIRISITDTGAGMEEDEIIKALSPFGQLDTAHSRSVSGSGLGLTLVNGLVKMHDGKMDIFSQKGIGTTVTVELPASRYVGETGSNRSGTTPAKNVGSGADATDRQMY